MGVHVRKCLKDNFKCGLCDFTEETLENLEMSIDIEVSENRCRTISRKNSQCLYHLKMDRNDANIVDFKQYRSDKI